MHDPRVGRFFARDPLSTKYPELSPYQFGANRVIDRIELEGLESAEDWQMMDRWEKENAQLRTMTSEEVTAFHKKQAITGILSITALIDIFVTKGWLTRTITGAGLIESINETERGYEAQAKGNYGEAHRRFVNAGEASKVVVFGLVAEGAGYAIGKLIRVASKLNLRVYRYEKPARVDGTWKVNEYNIAADHRYTAPGQGGVYSSMEPETALMEISHYGAQDGRVLVYKDFTFTKVLDLTKASVRKQMGVTLKEITSDGYNVTHKLGQYAKKNGYEAIIAPSARNKGGTNVVIINDK